MGYVTTTEPFATGWELLPRVSRSFALVIRWLPRRLDDAVMVSYLLCRIADTLEDSLRPAGEKRRLLERFAASLDGASAEIPADGPPDYACLMSRTGTVLAAYRELPESARAIIRDRVREMCGGMAEWCDRPIRTLEDQNRYCYFVAGLVGLLLTDLFRDYGALADRHVAPLRSLAVDFGLALQKVNILRDFRADLAEGRCYWPSELLSRHGLTSAAALLPGNVDRSLRVMQELLEDHWGYLASALRYLTLLPTTQLRLRIFCAIPLFMAVATLRRCEGNAAVFLGPRPVKIPGRQVRGIVMRSLSLGSCNDYLQSWYRRWRRGPLERPSPFQAVAALLP
jgi:farnesyl-diphosphate farnesyltransferase